MLAFTNLHAAALRYLVFHLVFLTFSSRQHDVMAGDEHLVTRRPTTSRSLRPMTTDSFSWLHLTDFHYGLKDQGCLWPTLRQPFLRDLAELYERCGPWDAVLFTGDFRPLYMRQRKASI